SLFLLQPGVPLQQQWVGSRSPFARKVASGRGLTARKQSRSVKIGKEGNKGIQATTCNFGSFRRMFPRQFTITIGPRWVLGEVCAEVVSGEVLEKRISLKLGYFGVKVTTHGRPPRQPSIERRTMLPKSTSRLSGPDRSESVQRKNVYPLLCANSW